MKCSVWSVGKVEESIDYRFQVTGIVRGNYSKILDPIFKSFKEVGSGYNIKAKSETVIYSKIFTCEKEMTDWVKTNITFPTVYDKCNQKCTTKILVKDKKEVKIVKTRKQRTVKKD